MKKILLLLTFSAMPAFGQVINAPTCSQSDVQAAFSAVTNSTTTVNIPSGACPWAGTVTLTVPSGSTNLTIQGQTVLTGTGDPSLSNLAATDHTTITANLAGQILTITTAGASSHLRITGLTFQGGSAVGGVTPMIGISGLSQNVRIDHNHINLSTYNASGNVGIRTTDIEGVFDHNLCDDNQGVSECINVEMPGYGGKSFGDGSWSDTTQFGTANAFYIEQNTFNQGIYNDDCSDGGRKVYRFNTSNAGKVQTHPTGSGPRFRGCRTTEVYKNQFNGNPACDSSSGFNNCGGFLFWLSAGSSLVWGNNAPLIPTKAFSGYSFAYTLQSMRRNNSTYPQTATPNGWGYCGTLFNGTGSLWDQSSSTSSGYRCLDQPGQGVGDLLSGDFPSVTNVALGTPAWPREALEPVYEWLDTFTPVPSNPSGQVQNSDSTAFVNNTDYYQWCNASSNSGCASFTGATGTGSGVIASRPATCTTGVAYWATDQGSWNTSGNGAGNGVLYKCTSTNTWTSSYTPLAFPHPLEATNQTWYIRADGGSRFSTDNTSGQCDGLADVAYPGSGVNQHCAFNDLRFMWASGAFNTAGTFPGWGWVMAGGDTLLIRNCIQYAHHSPELPGDATTPIPGLSGDCFAGQNGDGTQTNDSYLGRWGDTPGSGPMSPPSGTPGNHTRILGANWNTGCSSKAVIRGRFGAGHALAVSGTSYLDVACVDITDSSECAHNVGTTHQCSTSAPIDDFASDGIAISNTTTNTTLTDINIHGMGNTGIHGATGDGVSLLRVRVAFNPSAGFNLDDGSGATGLGTLTQSFLTLEGNGCNEEYPIVHAFPASICNDDTSAGYGDAWGTTTVCTANAWHVFFDHALVRYNTQDGIDGLHICNTGSSINIDTTIAYGNMGNQIKLGASAPTLTNSFIYGSCNAMRNAIPGSAAGYNSRLTDFCRAGDQAVVMSISDNYTSTEQFNTIVSANTIASYWTCANTCTHPQVIYRNNTMVGYTNNATNGYPGGGGGQQPDRLYLFDGSIPQGFGIFTNSGSIYAFNSSFAEKEACPNTNETNSLCTSPTLTNQTWSITANTDSSPTGASNILGAGVTVTGITTDINGTARTSPPAIGAYNLAGAPTLVSIAVTPNPGAVNVSATLAMTCTATFSDSSTAPCTSPAWTDTSAHSSVNSSTGVVTGASAGSDTITATIGAISGNATVNVSAPTPPTASFSGTIKFSGTVKIQ